jgi:hypothetical protein
LRGTIPGVSPSSGPRDDLADAGVVAAVARALRDWDRKDTTEGRPPLRPLRETFWFLWEEPRLPPERARGKYPLSYRWSPDAARARRAGEDKGRLVIEHSPPLAKLLNELVDDPHLSDEQTLEKLRSVGEPVVMTREEHQRLAAAGRASSGDASRYQEAGIDIDAFAPLVEDPRS